MWVIITIIILFIVIGVVTAISEAVEKKRQEIRDKAAKDVLGDFNYQKEKNKILQITRKFPEKKYYCPACSGILVPREGKFGPFWGCSNYPNCKFTKHKI